MKIVKKTTDSNAEKAQQGAKIASEINERAIELKTNAVTSKENETAAFEAQNIVGEMVVIYEKSQNISNQTSKIRDNMQELVGTVNKFKI